MPHPLHIDTAPVFQRMLSNMLAWFDRAEEHATARKFDPSNYLTMKLAPDMLPMVKQVQITTDTVKGCMARLAGLDVPSWPDDEASFTDLRARVRKTLDYVASFDAATIDAGADRDVVLTLRNRDPLKFKGADYVRSWVMPNFYFHATTTYALLRHAGVDLGKSEFLSGRKAV